MELNSINLFSINFHQSKFCWNWSNWFWLFEWSAEVDCLFDMNAFLQLLEVFQLTTQILHNVFDLSLLDLTLRRNDFDILEDLRAREQLEELGLKISLRSLWQFHGLDVCRIVEEVDLLALSFAVAATLVCEQGQIKQFVHSSSVSEELDGSSNRSLELDQKLLPREIAWVGQVGLEITLRQRLALLLENSVQCFRFCSHLLKNFNG